MNQYFLSKKFLFFIFILFKVLKCFKNDNLIINLKSFLYLMVIRIIISEIFFNYKCNNYYKID